jgi:hypothetical protein
MSKLNNEVRELKLDELDDISGGSIVIIDPGYPIASMVATVHATAIEWAGAQGFHDYNQ